MDNKDMNTKDAFDNATKYSHLSSNTDKVTFNKRNRESIIFSGIIIIALIIWLLIPSSTSNSDYTRTKLKPSTLYDTNCIINSTNTVQYTDLLTNTFRDVYNKAGIQTYFVVIDNNDNLYNSEQAQEYTDSYYDSNIHLNNGLLFTYFYDSQSKTGEIYYAVGEDTEKVFDDQVMTSFNRYLSPYWNNASFDQIEVFNDSLDYTLNLYHFVEKKTFYEKYKKYIIGFCSAIAAITIVIIINIFRRIRDDHKSVDNLY